MRERAESLRRQASRPEALQDARRLYETALEKAPDDWSLHYYYGKLLLGAGESELAAHHMSVALKAYPWHVPLYVDLANAEMRKVATRKRSRFFRRPWRSTPITRWRIPILCLRWPPGSARVKQLRTFAGRGDRSWRLRRLHQHGDCARRSGGYRRRHRPFPKGGGDRSGESSAVTTISALPSPARDASMRRSPVFGRPLISTPTMSGPRESRNRAASEGRWTRPWGTSARTLEIDPRNAVAYNNLGSGPRGSGTRRARPSRCFRSAVEIDPLYVAARINLARILGGQGCIEEAIARDEKAVESILATQRPTMVSVNSWPSGDESTRPSPLIGKR